VWLALPEHRPGFGPDEARRVHRALNSDRYSGAQRVIVQEAGGGHAGAFPALETLVRRIRAGEVELGVVAGVDSYFDADTLDWLDAEGRLAHAEARSGLSPGEGASAVVLASDAARDRLDLPSLAVVRDVACARETRDPASDEGLLGEALGEAIARAMDGAGRGKQIAEHVYCDINGERERVDDWGFALLRAGARFRDGTAYATGVAECGDLGAACAPLNCAIAVEAWARRRASGATALVWGASWGGMRGAALLERSRG
jgi:3-oxoacyl-[acyl-carrier-protein] synthase-1